jgi:hypothetical protein
VHRIVRVPRRGAGPRIVLLVALAVLASGLAPASSLAAGNSFRTGPVSATIVVGASGTIAVVGNSSVPVSGAAASLGFDKTKVKLTAIAKGPQWVAAGASFGGYPTAANLATFIANANTAGKIPAIAAFFLDGSSSLAAGEHTLFTATFQGLATGTSSLTLPIGPSDGSMIDGSVATYGGPLTVTSTAGTVKTIKGPTASITAQPVWSLGTTTTVTWTATAGSGAVVSYDVRYRKAPWNAGFGALTTWLAATPLKTKAFTIAAGNTYCFSARAKDANAVSSAWTAETCTGSPLDDRSLARTGTWTLGASASDYRGTNVRSTVKNAALTRTTVSAKRLAIIATTCATCGTINVYWGATLIKSLNLHSTTTVHKVVLAVTTFAAVQTGTLKITVTSTGKPVIIDGLAIRPN